MFSKGERKSVAEAYEKEVQERFRNLVRPEGEELLRVLSAFREKRYLDVLREKNILLTKKSIKVSVTSDQLIIQSVNTITSLDKTLNTLIKRLREWYCLYDPEFSESVNDNQKFVELLLGKRKRKSSMGSDLTKQDLEPVLSLVRQLLSFYKLRDEQENYIETMMNKVAPNVTAIAGFMIGAKLLDLAGSLKKLATFPAGTIQLLGAEEALFRHLKTKAKSPKYGILHEHPLISQAKKQDHGKVARALADKISIAARVDYFKGKPIGGKLRNELEERFAK